MSLSSAEISSLLADCELSIGPSQAEQLSNYLHLLLKWNVRTNLPAVRASQEIVRLHFAHSLFCSRHIAPSAHTLLDFGSGAGFPGIPIALARPAIRATLAESQGRKAAFLREAVRVLNLNVQIWAQRVEAMPAEQLFDAITLRAVDQMESACRIAASRLAPGGQILILTTLRLTDSTTALLPDISWRHPIHLPHTEHGVLLIGTR